MIFGSSDKTNLLRRRIWFAISRASAEQKKSAYSELEQRTTAQAVGVDTAIAKPFELSKAAAAILSGTTHRDDAANAFKQLMVGNKGSVVADRRPTAPRLAFGNLDADRLSYIALQQAENNCFEFSVRNRFAGAIG